jgi:glycosyltransferase involved in cell wall biosynthesis
MNKICVYAIAKNEEQFVDRWVDSMSEADVIVVLDTGSTDRTVEKLKARGVTVETEIITPWRFDDARNASMKLIPEDVDICVCTDLDEVFEPGWANKLREIWHGESRVHYPFVWLVNPDGSDGVVFYGEKIHKRGEYFWVHAVHEVLTHRGGGEETHLFTDRFKLRHFPDPNKSRSQYLPLLEMDVKENPLDDRAAHYLGREYMFCGQYDKAIAELTRHLSLPTATWKDERCASMRFLYTCTGDISWLYKAIAEAPGLREPYHDMAKALLAKDDFYGAIYFAEQGLKITQRTMSYINDKDAWGAGFHDVLSVAYWWIGDKARAMTHIKEALKYEPDNDRFLSNERLINGGDAS